jgi:NAD(P)-dependent dehydrogenase (short-subunit alcohol dehydrogenase family)
VSGTTTPSCTRAASSNSGGVLGVEPRQGDLVGAAASRSACSTAHSSEFGGLDIFVGSAGIWPPDNVPIARMTDEQWRRTLMINLDAIFYCTREAARIIGATADVSC